MSLDQNPRHNKNDSARGAEWAVVESYRNVCATGGRPVAFTDCLCYGNPEKPEQMGDFVAGMRGVARAAKSLHLPDYPESAIPIIGGNVSLYNESQGRSIPPSPMIACIGRMADASQAVGFAFAQNGSVVYHIGALASTLAGSLHLEKKGIESPRIPAPNFTEVESTCSAVVAAIESGLVLASHDVSDGGLAVALAECAVSGAMGFDGSNLKEASEAAVLFGEFGGIIVEVAPGSTLAFEAIVAEHKVPALPLGTTASDGKFKLGPQIDLPLAELTDAWENGLRKELES